MNVIKNFFRYKIVKISTVILVIAIIVAGFSFFRNKPEQINGIITNGVRTTILRKTTISDTVTVTGTVESTATANVTGTVSNTTVSEILVSVGDYIAKGDVVIKLDTTKITENIEKAKEKLADNQRSAQEKYNNALLEKDRAYDKAIAAEGELNTAMTAYKEAENSFNLAVSAVSAEQSAYDNAVKAETEANDSLNTRIIRQNKAKREKSEAEALFTAAIRKEAATLENTDITQEEKDAATAERAAAEEADEKANKKLNKANNTVEKLTTEYIEAKNNAESALYELTKKKDETNYNNLQNTFNSAKQTYENKRANLDNLEKTYSNALSSYETALNSLENSATSDELEDLYEQYNDCILTAPQSGTVTAINVEVGGSANGTLAVIEDTRNLKISTSFAESDVQNISTGMKCTITSDANDKKITGYVSQISPTASGGSGMGMSSSSGDVSFAAEITIEGADHGLLIGMNAQAEVILSRKDNVFTVPYDAVGTNENGEKVVYVQNTDSKEEFTPVEVAIGMETDYYIEISSPNLSEGMVIRSSANADESGNEMFVPEAEDGEMLQAGGFGNIGGFGGGMPGGATTGGRPQGMPGGRG